MTGFLIDTNVLSELRRSRPHGAVLSWLEATPPDMLHVSAVTIGEVQLGIEKTRLSNPDRAQDIEAWLDMMIGGFDVLPMDARTFRTFARLIHGRPEHLVMDAMIAATALSHGLVVATRNVRDFAVFATPTLNPFGDG